MTPISTLLLRRLRHHLPPRLRHRPRHRLQAAVLVLTLLGGLAACGDDGGGSALPDAAGASEAADEGGDDSGDGSDLSPEDAMLEYAECMREHGIDMPDPEPGGGIRINGAGVDPEEMRAAEEECGHLMEQAIPDDAQREISAEDKQAMLDLAECMREKGYDMPDPQFDGGRVTQRVGPGGGGDPGFDPEDPQFQADHEDCADEAGLDGGGLLRREGE